MKDRLILVSVMMLFGSISLFVRNIDLPSSVVSLVRAVIGSLFLFGYLKWKGNVFSAERIRENFLVISLAGGTMGFNWIFLFESYKNTTVSVATLSYYLAPIIVLVLSPALLKEKLSKGNVLAVVAAMAGLVLVVNPGGLPEHGYNHFQGILYGVIAACLYASVILINKFIKGLSGIESTLLQLATAAGILMFYIGFFEKPEISMPGPRDIILLMIVGIVYTGIAYAIYFTVVRNLQGQTIAVLSYLDPITAVVVSVTFLGEVLTPVQMVGGLLILGATYFGEGKKKTPLMRRKRIQE